MFLVGGGIFGGLGPLILGLYVDRTIRMDRANVPRYVLISPVCRVVEVLVAMSCRSASPSGPIFLYQDRSIRWEAMFCPLLSRFVELSRCVRGLK